MCGGAVNSSCGARATSRISNDAGKSVQSLPNRRGNKFSSFVYLACYFLYQCGTCWQSTGQQIKVTTWTPSQQALNFSSSMMASKACHSGQPSQLLQSGALRG
jgi:hypothetical protein